MATRQVTLRVGTWFGEREIELAFPTHWEVVECRMGGHDRPALTEAEMRAAVQNPIGSPPLRELAQGKKEVVVLFDDMPKPTPAWRIAFSSFRRSSTSSRSRAAYSNRRSFAASCISSSRLWIRRPSSSWGISGTARARRFF